MRVLLHFPSGQEDEENMPIVPRVGEILELTGVGAYIVRKVKYESRDLMEWDVKVYIEAME